MWLRVLLRGIFFLKLTNKFLLIFCTSLGVKIAKSEISRRFFFFAEDLRFPSWEKMAQNEQIFLFVF